MRWLNLAFCGFFELAEVFWVWIKFGQERRLELLGIGGNGVFKAGMTRVWGLKMRIGGWGCND